MAQESESIMARINSRVLTEAEWNESLHDVGSDPRALREMVRLVLSEFEEIPAEERDIARRYVAAVVRFWQRADGEAAPRALSSHAQH